jgi:CheY-like chemotaxis protein
MNKRFFIIDDDEGILLVLQSLLEAQGHQVTGFTSSSKALQSILADPPDCVLTDIMMPEMDGVELCRQIRLAGLPDLRIVVVSAKVYQTDRERAMSAGANGFISKSRSHPEQMVQEIMSVFSDSISLGFWGCRGTMPVPGPGTIRYGGNTACVSLTFPDGHVFVFDAGTGIHRLGAHLMRSGKKLTGTLLISHPHWDHINYLPFFTPLFIPGNQFEIVGSPHGNVSLEQLVANQMDGIHFPITPRELGARISYRELNEGTHSIGPAQVKTMLLCHPGYCLGYRVHFGQRSICYVTDNELFPPDSESYSSGYVKMLCEFVQDADILITDTSYFDEEYPKRMGWGHSALSRVLEVATVAQVKELYLYHHVPEHDDEDIDRMLEQARQRLRASGSSTLCKAAIAEETVILTAS